MDKSKTIKTDAGQISDQSRKKRVYWFRLIATLAVFIVISFGFVALLNVIKTKFEIDVYQFEWLACIAVFIVSLIANMTIVAPVPFALIIMTTAAAKFNPFLIGACAAAGGAIGELSGYYAGLLGKKIAIPDTLTGYQKVEYWVNKYGFWAIFILAVQPVIPFDLGGLIAGTAKMPLIKFFPALLAGKLIKFIAISAAIAYGFKYLLPSWLIS